MKQLEKSQLDSIPWLLNHGAFSDGAQNQSIKVDVYGDIEVHLMIYFILIFLLTAEVNI